MARFENVKRDYNKTLKQQVKEGEKKGYQYLGCFGRCDKAVLKFIVK